jgi:hypothetical protein
MVTKNKSKSLRILELIKASGEEGMRFTDIQRALWEMSHKTRPFSREVRGYWCTNLCGGGNSCHPGLLYAYCSKNDAGRWVLTEAFGDKPWKLIDNNCAD